MPEIVYKDFEKALAGLKKTVPPVFLIYGDEYLYKKAFNSLLDVLVPGDRRSLNYEAVDSDASVFDAVELLNTYSFLGGDKVVALPDSRVFFSKQDEGALLEKARKDAVKGAHKKASRYFLSVLALRGMSIEEVLDEKGPSRFKLEGDTSWLTDLAAYCKTQGLTVPEKKDDLAALSDAVRKGFPSGNHLIITAELVDKRKNLYKTVKELGLVVDCSVPKGDRAADKKVQEQVLRERMNEMLSKKGIKMDERAFQHMISIMGFDLRMFSGSLDKLIDFAGDSGQITEKHVKHLLKRSKEDPIYELTGAYADRNPGKVLFFMDSLLAGGAHPLQILAALVNQTRKMLVIKGFAVSSLGRSSFRPGMRFDQFKSQVLPAMEKYDSGLVKLVENEEAVLSGGEGTGSRKGKKVDTDLKVAPNPKNPYPIFLALGKSGNFSGQEIIKAMEILSDVDIKLKSSGEDHRYILEYAIIEICRR